MTQINFSFPKSIYAVKECLESLSNSKYAHFLDYFAGSGTTGHAVVDMNRDDNGFRKFSLVEQGEYFGNDSNLLIVFYVQIMPDDLVMQLHRF